jgi:hypothetical protein
MSAGPSSQFYALRLRADDEKGWAVIRRDTGAIALDAAGELLIRLGRSEAEALAAEMTRSAPAERLA